MGYWSSIIILVICAGMIIVGGSHLTTMSFVLVGLWWFGFSHITFSTLPKNEVKVRPEGNILFQGFRELKGVAAELRSQVHLKRYLFSFFFMNIGHSNNNADGF